METAENLGKVETYKGVDIELWRLRGVGCLYGAKINGHLNFYIGLHWARIEITKYKRS